MRYFQITLTWIITTNTNSIASYTSGTWNIPNPLLFISMYMPAVWRTQVLYLMANPKSLRQAFIEKARYSIVFGLLGTICILWQFIAWSAYGYVTIACKRWPPAMQVRTVLCKSYGLIVVTQYIGYITSYSMLQWEIIQLDNCKYHSRVYLALWRWN